jgi:peptide/nickel transport system permease protein
VTAFVLKRLALMALTMLVVSLLLFLLLELTPGSVATKVLGPYATGEQKQLWLAANGYLRACRGI